jgi:hypothetical protein
MASEINLLFIQKPPMAPLDYDQSVMLVTRQEQENNDNIDSDNKQMLTPAPNTSLSGMIASFNKENNLGSRSHSNRKVKARYVSGAGAISPETSTRTPPDTLSSSSNSSSNANNTSVESAFSDTFADESSPNNSSSLLSAFSAALMEFEPVVTTKTVTVVTAQKEPDEIILETSSADDRGNLLSGNSHRPYDFNNEGNNKQSIFRSELDKVGDDHDNVLVINRTSGQKRKKGRSSSRFNCFACY